MEHFEVKDLESRRRLYALIENKHMVEQFLAEYLMLFFDEDPTLEKIMRDMVNNALKDLQRIGGLDGGTQAIEDAWNGDCHNYKVLKKPFVYNAAGLDQRIGDVRYKPSQKDLGQWDFKADTKDVTWKLTEVNLFAEFIRFYGEVVEKLEKAGVQYGKTLLKAKEAPKKTDELRSQMFSKNVWGQPKKGDVQGTRDRDNRLKWTEEKNRALIAQERQQGGQFWGDYLRKISGGINVWKLEDDSLFNRMDRVFGLAKGAEVSGTTTDTYFFMRKFTQRLDPIFYLLPFGMIVAGGHHTTLEVAVPLAINGVVDYSIGLYTTLLPKQKSRLSEPERIISNHLKDAENSTLNALFLVYYENQQPAGYFLFDKVKDRDLWKRIAKADVPMMQNFLSFENFPNKDNVLSLIKGRGYIARLAAWHEFQARKLADYVDSEGNEYVQEGQGVTGLKRLKDSKLFRKDSQGRPGVIAIMTKQGRTIGHYRPAP